MNICNYEITYEINFGNFMERKFCLLRLLLACYSSMICGGCDLLYIFT
jgi:hypothetical protein